MNGFVLREPGRIGGRWQVEGEEYAGQRSDEPGERRST